MTFAGLYYLAISDNVKSVWWWIFSAILAFINFPIFITVAFGYPAICALVIKGMVDLHAASNE